jgi:PKD repeat protein
MKKTILKVALILTASISLINCSSDNSPAVPTTPAPTVDYTYTGGGSPAPAVVSFTSNTTNTTTYLWDFGDNSTSTIANPQHSYTTGGTYTVKLTVTGAGGTTSTTKTVNIAAALTKVKITKVTLTTIPFTTAAGTGWDLLDGPDIFFQIQNISGTSLFDIRNTFNVVNNVVPSNLPIVWTLTTPYDITDLTQWKFIHFYDNDTTVNDDMSYVSFLFSNYTSGTTIYPSTISQTQNGITITLNLTWY